jgi:hypothetical protein
MLFIAGDQAHSRCREAFEHARRILASASAIQNRLHDTAPDYHVALS